jgi:hypothetical protein
MIVANRKPFEEIVAIIKPYSRILLLGCNECVTVCATGGEKEVAILASEIRLFRLKEGNPVEIKEVTLERNCDPEYVESLGAIVNDWDVILSMACGCGIQFVGERYPHIRVLPAVNTTFYGVTEEHGVWTERCQDVATASWIEPSVYVLLPGAQRVYLMDPVEVLRKEGVK